MGSRQPHKQPHIAALCVLSVFLQLAAAERWPLINNKPGNVLSMVLTDCAKYQDWQVIAAAFAWRRSGQGGSVVRVANCNEKDTKNYDKKMLEYVNTHMAPLYAWNEDLKDWYAPYNKPGAVIDYFKHHDPKEDYVVILDADMLVRKPFDPKDLPLERGWAYAGHYDYLIGTDNDIALRHVPEIAPRNDTKAGHIGRRGDRVGAPYYMHKDDLRKVAPQWLNYTKLVRADMEAYKNSGDTASKKGGRIWIAEMYGYSFGAAKVDVWHYYKEDFFLYPSYTPGKIPYVIHYGLIYHVGNWTYDKHFYFDFDSHKCPPWDLNVEKPKAGIFPPPPGPDQIKGDFMNRYKDIFAVSAVSIINAALCDYHVRNCPPSPQLTKVCNEAFKLYWEVDQAIKDIEWNYKCKDHNNECKGWAARGECTKMPAYMHEHCAVSCGDCTPQGPRTQTAEDQLMTVEILSKEVGKQAAPADGPDPSVQQSTQPSTATTTLVAHPQPSPVQTAMTDDGEQEEEEEDVEEQKPKVAQPKVDKQQQPKVHQEQPKQEAKSAADEEADMKKRFRQSTMSYAALVKRCLDLQGLNDDNIRECVKAAAFRLEYPGTLKPEAALTAAAGSAVKTIADAAAGAAGGVSKTAAATADKLVANGAAAATNDLAALHAHHFDSAERIRLGRGISAAPGTLSFVEQSSIVIVAVGVVWLALNRLQHYRRAKAKQHGRSD